MKALTSRLVTFLATSALALGQQWAFAVTTNLTAVADTGLWTGAPDNNLGQNTFLPIGTSDAGAIGRGLVRFDLSGIPLHATINSATLTFQVLLDHSGASTVSVHRMLQRWIEGTGRGFSVGSGVFGTPALPGEPTWNTRASPGTMWGGPGGLTGTDFVSTASATTNPVASSLRFSSEGLTADIQLFVSNAATNLGWLFKQSVEGSGGARRIATREDTLNSPQLLLDYAVSAPTTQPKIFGLALTGNAIRFSFNAQSNLTYAVESREALGATNWTVLNSIAAKPTDTIIDLTNTISSTECYFRVRTP